MGWSGWAGLRRDYGGCHKLRRDLGFNNSCFPGKLGVPPMKHGSPQSSLSDTVGSPTRAPLHLPRLPRNDRPRKAHRHAHEKVTVRVRPNGRASEEPNGCGGVPFHARRAGCGGGAEPCRMPGSGRHLPKEDWLVVDRL